LIEEVGILSWLNIHCAWKLFAKKFAACISKWFPQDIPKESIFMSHRSRALNLRNKKHKLWNK